MTHSRSGIACTLALLWVLGCTLPAQALAGDIIVRRDSGLDASERADVRATAGVTHERMMALPDAEVVSVSDDHETVALATLNADPDVRYAVPDVRLTAADAPPDDPNGKYFPIQWGLEQGNDADIDILKAWEAASTDGAGVTVAVADQQVDVTHPDLDGNIEPGGRDFVRSDGCTSPTPTGRFDHGTHIAGIIAAERDPGRVGIAGVAPLAHILPLRAIDNCGDASLSWVIDAFEFAGEQGIPIVTGSFGSDPLLSATRKAEINKAFSDVFAAHQNTLYVVASGNQGNDNDENPVYPCSTLDGPRTEPPNLICVGMTDQTDAPVCSGNVGASSVDIYAPGQDIVSTVGINGYWPLSGTSTATPMVAAVAALFLSQDLGTPYAASDVREAVTSSADRLGFAPLDVGRLNAARAVGVRSGLGSGGPGHDDAWVSCDTDHDGYAKSADKCPDQPGTLNGCPDADRDGLRDTEDNCPTVKNLDQSDVDGDGIGDACDTTIRGDDVDGDTKGSIDDRCPFVAGFTSDGCPPNPGPPNDPGPAPTPAPTVTPTATPTGVTRILDLDVRVTPPKCPKGRPNCTKAAKVTVKLSRKATVALKLEMRIKRKGRWVWTRVTSKSVTATASGRSLTIRGKSGRSLAKGPYRVTASLTASKTALNFRV